MTTDKEAPLDERAAEIAQLRARVEVAESGYHAAVQTAQWQSLTNRELNECQDELRRLRAGQQEQAVLSDLSDEQIDAIAAGFELGTTKTISLMGEGIEVAVNSPIACRSFARAILAASADLDRGLLEQVLAALEDAAYTLSFDRYSTRIQDAAIASIRSRLEPKP